VFQGVVSKDEVDADAATVWKRGSPEAEGWSLVESVENQSIVGSRIPTLILRGTELVLVRITTPRAVPVVKYGPGWRYLGGQRGHGTARQA
jgi:hypothetical protein